MAQWNTHERCWDDTDGVEFWRNHDEILQWMVAPAPPPPPAAEASHA